MTPNHFRGLLAGGIGSGKSTVGRILARLEVRVIDADAVGHEVLEGPVRAAVAARWPTVIRDGHIDRTSLGRIVFADTAELRELERMTHPVIRERVIDLAEGEAGPLFVEVPLPGPFLGPGWFRLVVDAPERIRIERLLRRGMRPRQIVQRMAVQPMRQIWLSGADKVIENTGTYADLEEAVTAWWTVEMMPDAAGGPA